MLLAGPGDLAGHDRGGIVVDARETTTDLQPKLKQTNLAPAVAAVQAATKDPQALAALTEFVSGKAADGTKVERPSEQAKGVLKAISKAADTDFNQFALAQVVVNQANTPLAEQDLERISARLRPTTTTRWLSR